MSMGDSTFGSGVYGGTATSGVLSLRVTDKSDGLISIAWDHVDGVQGWLFFRNGVQISRSFNAALTHTRFSYQPGDTFEVRAIRFALLASGSVKA